MLNFLFLTALMTFSTTSNAQEQRKQEEVEHPVGFDEGMDLLGDKEVDDISGLSPSDQYIETLDESDYHKITLPEVGSFIYDGKNAPSVDLFLLEKCREAIRPNSVVVELGSKFGLFSVPLSNYVGEGGLVLAFEGRRKYYLELEANLRINECSNVIAHHVLAGSIEEMIGLHTFSHSSDLEVRTLDSYELRDVSFIRIDLTGHEMEALDGAAQTIAREKPIIMITVYGDKLEHFKRIENPEWQAVVWRVRKKLSHMGYRMNTYGNTYYAVPIK